MSRGLGAVERGILECLTTWAWPQHAAEIAGNVFGREVDEPTAAELASVRRALRHLAARGLIKEFDLRSRSDRRKLWTLPEPPPGRRKTRADRAQERLANLFSQGDNGLGQKFAKILGMLGSDHAGERLAAVRAAEELRKQNRLTWLEIVRSRIPIGSKEGGKA